MNYRLWLSTLAVCSLYLLPATAQNLNLQDAMRLAEQRGEVLAAQAQANAAAAQATAVERSGYLPQVQVSAFLAYSSEASQSTLTIPTPNGPISQTVTFAEQQKSGFSIALNQPLVNVANWWYQAPAKQLQHQAATLQAEHVQRAARLHAAEAYLNVLVLQAQRDAVNELIASLDAQVAKLNSLVEGGRVLASEGLRVELSRDSAKQARLELTANMTLAQAELARVVGLATVTVANQSLNFPKQWPTLAATDNAWRNSWDTRKDLLALEEQLASLGLQVDGVDAEWLPTLNGQLKYSHSNGVNTTPDNDTQAALSLEWTPYASGTRAPRQQALEAQRQMLLAQRDESRLGIRVQLEQARQHYRIAEGLQALALTAVDSAKATLQTRSARFDAGRANVDDVLAAQAEVAEQSANAQIANYQRLRAWLQWQLAIGDVPAWPQP